MSATQLVIIGASWGGLHAVSMILAGLPRGFRAPILVVQHRPEDVEERLTGLLRRSGPLSVVEVEDKAAPSPGCVYVAPAGYHVLLDDGHFALSTDERVRNSRPSIDVALESGAEAYGQSLIGVVLTGANDDGAAGLSAVRRRGGIGIVQDPAGAEASRMPAAAVAAARPQVVVALDEIAPLLVRLVGA